MNNNNNTNPQKNKPSFGDLWQGLSNLLTDILSLKHGGDTDVQGTIEGIKKDIEFRGHTVWILILSIFIASIGLNQNSTAVVIGAMLISPLMGPILGIGLSLGTNDIKTLIKALKNFGVMIVMALLTSTIYFWLTPIVDVQQEILNRTQPNMLDAVIAFVGGLAGIIAGSRKEKTNVIPGVAIATALMPPLCTAGFGLATGNYQYFLGAFYLFLLNSVFICLATILVVKYLHFPLAAFMNKEREKRGKFFISIFTILLLAPSIYVFYGVSQESLQKRNIEDFIEKEFTFSQTNIIKQEYNFSDSLTTVEIFCIGEYIKPEQIEVFNQSLKKYELKNVVLHFHQSSKEDKNIEEIIKNHSTNNDSEMNQMYVEQIKASEKNNKIIDSLKNKINELQKIENNFEALATEVKDLFEVEKIGYANSVETDFKNKKTIPTFLIHWVRQEDTTIIHESEEIKMRNWLQNKLKVDTLRLIHY
ncbi:MAG: TIGR00341 family protein [Cytophagales bacterium]|nr:TIGR00341 family protein [Cytophagales bacterium]